MRLAAPFRPELLAHCYRLLGSAQDAEDLVQETYLRAWRGYDRFEGRSSLRFWLYRIATSACLTALRHHSRRVVPAGLGGPATDPDAPHNPAGPEISWVQPLPDALLGSAPGPFTADPAAIVVERGSVRLALVVALQRLPPKQRVVLILREVLGWRAAEVAELLDTSTAAVNSALQRARSQLDQDALTEDDVRPQALDARHRELLDGYARAFADADIEALLRLLRDDVTLEMPPEPYWFAGRADVGRFIGHRIFRAPGVLRTLPVTANGGQLGLAMYWRDEAGDGRGGELFRPHCVQMLMFGPRTGAGGAGTGAGGLGVAGIIAFRDPSMFGLFGLPAVLS
jgi:RNA polymerase sigma-70 factor (ECF subfamily)